MRAGMMETSISRIHPDLQLQDLKTLRSQLYSAAEYFELSYTQDEDAKQT
jgi:hypothetical protein